MTTLTVNLDGIAQVGGTTFVHDYALDGDEDLQVGKLVRVTDGSVQLWARMTGRDDAAGRWFCTTLGSIGLIDRATLG